MKALLIIPSLVSTVALGTLGTYKLTKESIQEKVSGHCLLESASLKGWKLAEENLKKESSSDNLALPFQELRNKLKAGSYQNTGKDLKEVCVDLYSWDSSNIFKSENEFLTTQIKKYCSLTIKEQLGETNLLPESGEDSLIQKKIEELASHTNEKGILTVNLKKIKESSDLNKNQNFIEACKELYKMQFLSETSNEWKLTENYCKKQ